MNADTMLRRPHEPMPRQTSATIKQHEVSARWQRRDTPVHPVIR